jgi:hypothetical protein
MKFAIALGVVALGLAGPAAADTWQAFSRSQNSIFVADVGGIATEGEITAIRLATVPRSAEAGDYSHQVERYEFRCAQGDWRTAGIVEYGPDEAEVGQYPEVDAAWETMRSGTIPAYLKEIACAGARPTGAASFETVRAFIDAGRP